MRKQDYVTWEKISDQFHQKKSYNGDTASTKTYYYRSKLGKLITVIEINTYISKKLCAYTLIENDIKDCFGFLEEYQKIVNEEKANELIIKALIKSLVITYGKCFTKNYTRNLKLEKNIFSPKIQILHDKMMQIRHTYVAHADSSTDEHCKFVLLMPPEKFFKKKNVTQPEGHRECVQRVHSIFFLNDCRPLLEGVNDHVKKQILILNNKINEEIKLLSPDKIYTLLKNNRQNRCILNEEDLKKMRRDYHHGKKTY